MTTLPSISNLLNDTVTHPLSTPSPSFHLSPPSPLPTTSATATTSNTPILSPSTSCISLSPRMDELPPLQGYDPPVRKLSGIPIVAPWSNDSGNMMMVATPPSPPESSSTCSISSPPPSHTYEQQHLTPPPSLPSPPPTTATTRTTTTTITTNAIQQQPTAQIFISPTTGQPILKRRRGRPPTNREPVNGDGGFTFLAPVTWSVQQPLAPEQVPEPKTDQHEMMAAFSSSNMDTVLQMPRKKRGRKPKTQLAGNSCFVWKELPATRSTKKVVKKKVPKPSS
ncbi:hypothetical protein BDC45DRAFT_506987 [Circinella umbellata]|nr:hypothetical protein BDC45DRAFT_506987 [Circinella umbellata]